MDNPAHEFHPSRALRGALLFLLRGYQRVLSPLFGNNCRFYPCCSNYALEAIDQHGCGKGSLLVVRRVLRCNPLFSEGGFDPVPPITTQPDKQN